jgi:hypothetical protein
MEVERHDPQKDVGKPHAQAEGGALGFSPLSASPMDGTDGGTTRRAPALTLEASQEPQDKWKKTSGHDRAERQAAPEPLQEAAAYRARMLAKVGGDESRNIAFTDAELGDFITHAKGLGFSQEDIEAIVAVKVRKHWVESETLKDVADCLAKKRTEKRIRFKEGWDFMRAYRDAQEAMLGGNALAPEVYLAVDYVEEHTETFSSKASYLLPGKHYDMFVNPEKTDKTNLGYNGALYVSSAAEINRVLDKARGDIAEVERLLGIKPRNWQGQQGLWRVDILDPETKGLRIPDGFEASANEFWTPGALTSGGTLEAVLDEVPRIDANHTFKQVIQSESMAENP